jgi:hypothetical protein
MIGVYVLASLGAYVAWKLHELLLILNTAFMGGVLVGIGVAGERLTELPVVQRPGLLLREPVAVLLQSVAVVELAAVTALVVFCGGAIAQWRDVSVLGYLAVPLDRAIAAAGNLFGTATSVPLPDRGRSATERTEPRKRTDRRETESPATRKDRPTTESQVPAEPPEDDTGFYTK